MKDSLIIEGKTYISAGRAAKIVSYAQDYVGQLCRSGKLDCKMVGRSWFVTEASLLAHRENANEATQERVSKIIRSAPEPLLAKPASFLVLNDSIGKYEADNKPALPEITKKVPAEFSLPKNIISAQTATAPLPAAPRPLALALMVAFLVVGGIYYSYTLSGIDFSKFSFEGNNKAAAVQDAPVLQERETVPVSADEEVSIKIANLFSDEVVVKPDENGNGTIITPVFRKGDGREYRYTVVPADREK